MKKLKNSKGFTLMEMLIVVAIIAILIAIAIPAFSKQLEKAREATDMANLRSAYAEVMAAALTDDKTENTNGGVKYNAGEWTKTVEATQKIADWQSGKPSIGGIEVPDCAVDGETWTVKYVESTGVVTITLTTNGG